MKALVFRFLLRGPFSVEIMFQSYGHIQRRHGRTGTDRAYHLHQLTQEYKTTEKQGKKNY